MARMPRRAGFVLGMALVVNGCDRSSFEGPHALLRDVRSRKQPRTGSLTTAGETRAALLESARYRSGFPPARCSPSAGNVLRGQARRPAGTG